MNEKIKDELLVALNKCDNKHYPKICEKMQYKNGRELVVNMVYNRLVSFPNWDVRTALSDVEINLKGFADE